MRDFEKVPSLEDYPDSSQTKERERISVVIITQNEERWIGRCLQSACWADEVVVLDALSTDRTKAIATDSQAPWSRKLKWVENKWNGFKDQRNLALDNATNNWVLIVDSDECVSPELARKVLNVLEEAKRNPSLGRYYKVRRIEFFLGKPIFHGIWNPSYQDRFFHKDKIRYINDVHEYPVFPSQAELLHEPLIHAPDFHPEKFLSKMNRYTSIEARDRYAKGFRTNLIHLLGSFPAMFLKNYFYYGAYKDGAHGLIISLLEGVSRVVRHIKLWQLAQAERPKN